MADDVSFPCESFKEAAPHLRRPFAPPAVRWKIQTSNLVVGYVDARTVIARLNLVVPHLWEATYEPWGERVDTNLLVCHLTIDGLTRSDIGKGQGKDVQKAAYSDALKRAAVHFGVGHSLYAIKRIYLNIGDGSLDSNGVPTLTKKQKGSEIGRVAEEWLRDTYAKWLETDRGKHFGSALDHGDEPDAVGDVAESEAAPETAQDDLEIAAKRAEVEALYDKKIAKGNGTKSKFPKGRFTARLDAATSVEKLDELAADVEQKAKA